MGSNFAVCICARKIEHPVVVFSPQASKASFELRMALDKCKSLQEPFELGCIVRCDTLSLIPTALPDCNLPVEREEISGLPDGGMVAVDWVGKQVPKNPSFVVLMFPGTGTNAHTGFTAMIAHYMADRPDIFQPEVAAVGVAVMQGFDGLPLLTTKLIGTPYVALDDAGHIIEHVSDKFPDAAIVVVACSIGGAFFTHWAGAYPERCKKTNVVGAVVIAHGFDVYKSVEACEATVPCNYILGAFRETLRQSPPNLELLAKVAGFNMDSLHNAKSIREWDAALLPLYDYADYDSMLRAADTKPLLDKVQVPIVFLSTDNDPVAPATRLIDEGRVHEVVPNCAVIRTEMGSHMAWWQGSLWSLQQQWACSALSELVGALAVMPRSH